MCTCMSFTFIGKFSPACDPGTGAMSIITLLTGQTHWSNVVCEGHSFFQTQQGNVIVEGEPIVVRVNNDL